MNKELKRLKAIEDLLTDFCQSHMPNKACDYRTQVRVDYGIDIIENALKDYENTKTRLDDTQTLLWKNQNKLKALDIIKEKRVNVEYFVDMLEDWKDITYEQWIIYYYENAYFIQGEEDFENNRLTKGEFISLKEVLL